MFIVGWAPPTSVSACGIQSGLLEVKTHFLNGSEGPLRLPSRAPLPETPSL